MLRVRQAASIAGLGLVLAAVVWLPYLQAQSGDGDMLIEDLTAAQCPPTLFTSVRVDGIWFDNVYATKIRDTGSSTAVYNVANNRLSRNGSWIWIEGSLTTTCYRGRTWRSAWIIVLIVQVIDTGGSLIPAPPPDVGEGCEGEGTKQEVRGDPRAGNRFITIDNSAVCEGGPMNGEGPPSGTTGCQQRFGRIEISTDGGLTWSTWWEGYYWDCGQAET